MIIRLRGAVTQINYRAEPEMNRALKANSATRRPTWNWRPRALDEFQGRRLSSFPCSQVHRDALGGHDVVYPTNQVNGMGFLRVRTVGIRIAPADPGQGSRIRPYWAALRSQHPGPHLRRARFPWIHYAILLART